MSDRELKCALREISEGVDAVMTRVNRVESRVDGMEGTVISHGEFLRERKLGLGRVVSLPGVNEGKDQFSLAKAVVAIGMKHLGQDVWKEINGGYELEVLTQATRKAMDTGTGGAGGGYVVPQQALTDFIERLYANTTVIKAGARVYPNLSGSPVLVPKQLTSANIYWIAENPPAGITKSVVTHGNLIMTPKTMAARAQYSNLLALLSNPNIEEIMRRDFAKIAALELDRVVLRGEGGAEPVGLANMPQIGTLSLGADGGYFDWATAVDMEGVLEDENAMPPDGKFSYVMHGKIKRQLKKTRIPQFSGDTGGAFVVPPIISDSLLKDMLGYPFYTTTQIPTDLTKESGTNLSEVYFANWDDVIIGLWGNLEILASNVAGDAWAQNAVEIRLIQNVDVQVRNLESVCYVNDARTV